MKLAKLKQLSTDERKADLLAMEDGELAECVARLKGWEDDDEFPETFWLLPDGSTECKAYIEGGYNPATDLNQAYELLDSPKFFHERLAGKTLDKMDYYHMLFSFGLEVSESEAQTHARAVTILAILGLLEAGDE